MKDLTKKIEELILQESTFANSYSEKPAYYLQINKSACRLLVRVNDIPLGRHFVKDAGQTMLYPINDRLFTSGEHVVSIEVYPVSTALELTEDSWVNVKVIYFKDKHDPDSESKVLEELNLPSDIGKRHLPYYTASMVFTAQVPFNHRQILEEAVDLRTVENLEEKVLAHYNLVRSMMIKGEYYEYLASRVEGTWLRTDMNYLTEESLRKAYLDSDAFFRFNRKVINWIALPIENYEMVICGGGKLVYLLSKKDLDDVLRVEFYRTEKQKEARPHKRSVSAFRFIVLYMPKGSDRLIEIY